MACVHLTLSQASDYKVSGRSESGTCAEVSSFAMVIPDHADELAK